MNHSAFQLRTSKITLAPADDLAAGAVLAISVQAVDQSCEHRRARRGRGPRPECRRRMPEPGDRLAAVPRRNKSRLRQRRGADCRRRVHVAGLGPDRRRRHRVPRDRQIHPTADAWVVSLNAAGGRVWQRRLGGTGGRQRRPADGRRRVYRGRGDNFDRRRRHGQPRVADAWVVELECHRAVDLAEVSRRRRY